MLIFYQLLSVHVSNRQCVYVCVGGGGGGGEGGGQPPVVSVV